MMDTEQGTLLEGGRATRGWLRVPGQARKPDLTPSQDWMQPGKAGQQAGLEGLEPVVKGWEGISGQMRRAQKAQPHNLCVPTGVIDDRGKFIYITPEELAAVANFIRQRGRVSITELAQASNSLIAWGQEPPTQAPA